MDYDFPTATQTGGGCGCAAPQVGGAQVAERRRRQQVGGNFSAPTETQQAGLDKAAAWRAEVKALREANPGMSYKEALHEASLRRQEGSEYKTVKTRYVQALDKAREERKSDREYKPSGKKNKRPLTMEAAQRILLKYYRDRADQFEQPLSALKKKIASCTRSEAVLKACPTGTRSRASAKQADCDKAWKYRTSKLADASKRKSGPARYSIDGLDNLCGDEKKDARKASKLYNLKSLAKRVVPKVTTKTEENSVLIPGTNRRILKGGKRHLQLISEGILPPM